MKKLKLEKEELVQEGKQACILSLGARLKNAN